MPAGTPAAAVAATPAGAPVPAAAAAEAAIVAVAHGAAGQTVGEGGTATGITKSLGAYVAAIAAEPAAAATSDVTAASPPAPIGSARTAAPSSVAPRGAGQAGAARATIKIPAAAAAGDHQRRVVWPDDETAAAAAAVELAVLTRAAGGDAERLALCKHDIATDLGPQAGLPDVRPSSLGAERDDVVNAGRGHRVGDDAAGVGEGGHDFLPDCYRARHWLPRAATHPPRLADDCSQDFGVRVAHWDVRTRKSAGRARRQRVLLGNSPAQRAANFLFSH